MTGSTVVIRLRAYRGEQHNTTECFNGLRDEAASLIDNLIVERDALRAEVAALRANLPTLFARGYAAGHHDTAEGCYIHVLPIDMPTYFADRQEVINAALSNS
jgi:hypothetical protein